MARRRKGGARAGGARAGGEGARDPAQGAAPQQARPSSASGPAPSSASDPAPSRARLLAFRLVSAVALPLVLLALVEGVLRLAGAGHDPAFTVPCTARGVPAFCENSRFVEPFFPGAASRSPPPLSFPARKDPGTFRIFVLGESAALGDPEPAYGFSRYLEVLLRDRFPQVRFEVVNASTTAINSHALLPMARDLARHEPDLFVLYIGNNEVVGPFGAGSALALRAPPRWLVRARLAIASTRLGQLAGRALRRGTGAPPEWRGMEMFLGKQVPWDAPELGRVRESLRENLRDLIDAARAGGARVVVGTVAVNLRDSAPFAALHGRTLPAAELAEWSRRVSAGARLAEQAQCGPALVELRAAEAIDADHAELQFRIARCLEATADLAGARERFSRARDLDALRFRADSAVNAIVREVAVGPRVELVDAERALAAASPGGVPGADLFYEHVHLRPRGNDLLARAFFPAVARAVPAVAVPGELPAPAECDRRLALTSYDRRRVARDVFRRLEGAPFTNQLDHEARLARARSEGDLAVDTPEETAAQYRAALALWPADPVLRTGFASLVAATDPAQAIELLRPAIDAQPTNAGARELLAGALGRAGRKDEAVAEARALLRVRPDYPPGWVDLGYLLAAQGAFDEAGAAYERAAELAPSLAPGVLLEAGRISMHQREYARAAAQLQRALDAGATGDERTQILHLLSEARR